MGQQEGQLIQAAGRMPENVHISCPPLPEFYDLQQHSDTYEAINEKRASRIEIITNLINKLEKYGE